MKKVTKAIKALNGLSEEEKLEVAEFFKQEEQKEEQVEKQEEKKQEEEKIEQKDEQKSEVIKLFEAMQSEIKTLTEKVEKASPFGAKQKQQKSKDTNEFDDMFTSFRAKQRS